MTTYELRNPATGEPVGEAPDHAAADARAAAERARAAQAGWAATTLAERGQLLEATADQLVARRSRLVELAMSEVGATRSVAEATQVDAAIARLRRTAAAVDSDIESEEPPENGVSATVRRRPVGTVACIAPFNFPLLAMVAKSAPALMAGNPVVLKPAPQDPLLVVELAEAYAAAGAPEGVVNLVVGRGPELGAALVESPDIDMVSFTGSTAVGQQIYAAAAPTMKRLLLELGGKGALVVLDADALDAAVDAVSRTWLVHAGQVCLTPTRLLVPRALEAQAIELAEAALDRCVLGDPHDDRTTVGAVVNEVQADRITAMLDEAVAAGASLLRGGELPERGSFVQPSLVVGAGPGSRIAQHEVFGPVVTLLTYDDGHDDEAVAIANGTSYGLMDYVYATDPDRAVAVAERLRSGGVCINTTVRHPGAPFGGVGLSGLGRSGGRHALWAYTELQAVVRAVD